MIFPERGREIFSRALQIGESRVIAGDHFPTDTIAARIGHYYYLSQILSDNKRTSVIVDTAKNIRQHIHQQIATECRRSLRTCLSIQSEPIADAYKKNDYSVGYYGLITKKSASHLTPEQLPSQAHYLLRLRFPYLSNTDRQQILAGTAYPVNSLASWQAVNPNDVDKNWGLINLPLAYDGPTYLYHDLMVNQSEDNEQYDVADFALADVWKNDISGKGRLIKKGGGILILAGNNSFAGLEINKGTVVLTGNNHYSQSTIVNNGILVVNGTLSSAINLNNGGRLMGSGSIAALKVNKGGILALGKIRLVN
ncbi:autotransporter-associated beta strand repeat-containing protein [Candidatus Regiella insecticola]|uniref:autotransporter-associated beta strand repeat-containing protein n=1 Tax=Candidatus Regiella insecticola TaxID=138073 RepID=UPI0002ECE78D|nr:autotransporter-associated beta strand repeat-containing protein [Candidatus Regiella insecticola]